MGTHNEPDTGRVNHRTVLAVLLAGQFMANVDTAVANVAAPSIHERLHASGSMLQLTISGYVLAYAALLVVGARLGDLWGHRRAFVTGMAAFTLASAACAAAPDAAALVAARVVQGAGAALMVPQVMTGIQRYFSGPSRVRAIGMYVATLSGGAVAGQVLGGVLVAADLFGTGWRSVFAINVPVGLLAVALALRAVPTDGARGAAATGATGAPAATAVPVRRLDLAGVSWLSAALLLTIVPLTLGRDQGWPLWMWVLLAASVPAFAVFTAVERRVARGGRSPLVDLRLLRTAGWGLAANSAASGTYFSMLFVLALYLQQGLGRGSLYSGLVLVSWVAAFGLAGPVVRRVPAAVAHHVAPIGALLLAAAYAALTVGAVAGSVGGVWLVAVLGVGGFGLGTTFTGNVSHLTRIVPTRHASGLSGLMATATQLAGAAGVAGFGTLYLALAGHGPTHAFAVTTASFAATAAGSAGLAVRAVRRGAGPLAADAHEPAAHVAEPVASRV